MSRSAGFPDLTGKRALVTGASRGIGAVLAQRLAIHGAHVCINYSRDDESANQTLGAVSDAGGRGTLLKANLISPEEIRAMFAQVENSGGLDILIHNAAIGSFKHTLDVRPNQWDLTMAVNARALLLCAQYAAALMKGRAGRIVSVSSLGSTRVVPLYGAIGPSKAALESLTRYLALELAPRGILVNAVAAGLIDTASIRQHPKHDDMAKSAIERTPAGRLGAADDVASVVLFLCSSLADWVVGQTIVADGGMSLRL